MNDIELFIAALILIWMLWPFIAAAVFVMIRASHALLDRLAP